MIGLIFNLIPREIIRVSVLQRPNGRAIDQWNRRLEFVENPTPLRDTLSDGVEWQNPAEQI